MGLTQVEWRGWLAGYVVCRWDGLMLGMLAAVIVRHYRARQWLSAHKNLLRWGLLLFIFSAALVLYFGLGRYDSFDMNVIGYTWLGCGALLLVLSAVLQASPRLSGWLRAPYLRRLGRISYGIYLYHQLVLGLCHGLLLGQRPVILKVSDGLVTLLALGLTWLLATLSWEFFERYFVSKGAVIRYDTPFRLWRGMGSFVRRPLLHRSGVDTG